MQKFNQSQVYPTKNQDIPEDIKIWQSDVQGPLAIVEGCRALFEGNIDLVRFIVCNHPRVDDGQITKDVTVGLGSIEGEQRVRFTGERNSLYGAGSRSLASHPTDLLETVAILSASLGRQDGCIFRYQIK